MNIHEKISYVEFPSTNLSKTKAFFSAVFNWEFEDYGPEYIAFTNDGLDGGFYKASTHCDAGKGGALIVFFSNNLNATQEKVLNAGGVIVKPVFNFPGGCRFHFADTTGNEFAVWSDVGI